MQWREAVHDFSMPREKVAGVNLRDRIMEVVPEQ